MDENSTLFQDTPAKNAAPIARVGGAKLKLSLNAFCFDQTLRAHLQGNGGMSLFDLLEYCARLDFDAIDPTGYYFPGYPQIPDDGYLNEFKRRAFRLGLDISGTGVRNDFATPDGAKRTADVRLVKQWVEVAARLGAPVLRVFAGPVPEDGHTWEDAAGWMADALRECAEHGAKYGVLIGLQNHGDMLRCADEMLNIVDRVDSDWLGLILDTGNFLVDDPYAELTRAIPYAVNWQIKERLHNNQGAKIDLKRLVGILRDSGYRGYIPIETLSRRGEEYDPKARVEELLQDLRDALAG